MEVEDVAYFLRGEEEVEVFSHFAFDDNWVYEHACAVRVELPIVLVFEPIVYRGHFEKVVAVKCDVYFIKSAFRSFSLRHVRVPIISLLMKPNRLVALSVQTLTVLFIRPNNLKNRVQIILLHDVFERMIAAKC